MDILKVVALGIISTVIIMMLGEMSGGKNYAQLIRIIVVSTLLIFVVGELGGLFNVIQDLASKMSMDHTYLNIILKIVGIAYIAEFGASLCEDAGEKAIGSKIQLTGKVMIFVIASPVFLALVELITDLL